MKTKIDLIKSKKLTRILSGKEQREDKHARMLAEAQLKFKNADSNPDPGTETPSYLFYFERKYYHVKGVMKKIVDADVSKILKENPDTKIYFLCAANLCPMGEAISGRPMESKKVKDTKEAAEFMTKTSGVTITVNNL